MRAGWVVLLGIVVACGGHSKRTGVGPTGSSGSGATSSGGSGGAGVTGGRGGVGGRGGSGPANGGTGAGGVGGVGGSGGRASGGSGAVGGSPDDGGMSQGGAPDERGGSGGTAARGGTAGTAGHAGSPITSCTEEFAFLGTWEGNVLDFYFEPVEALRLEVEQRDGSSDITGTLTWGDGDPPPPPESADAPYPPGFWDDRPDLDMGIERGIEPWPGFPYTVVRGAGCDSTFRFGISTYELFEDWCALQTPVFTPEYGWGCVQQGGGSSNLSTCTVNGETYPLWKCAACGAFGDGVCSCDEDRCFANPDATRTFDLALSSSSGSEILSGPDPGCGDCTVRLERKP